MKIRRFAAIFIVLAVVLVVTMTGFVLMVPIDFYATASGRIAPVEFRSVAAALSGVVEFVIDAKEFKKGDVLLRLDASDEKEALKQATLELAVLEKRLAWEKAFLAYNIKQKELRLRENAIKAKALDSETSLQTKQLAIAKNMTDKLKTHRELEEDMKEEEAKMMKSLFERKVVAKMEFLKIIHQARVAKIMTEQATMEADRQLFERENSLNKLGFDKRFQQLEKDILELSPKPESGVLELEERVLKLKGLVLEVEAILDKKIVKAPFDGRVLLRRILPGEFLKQDEPALDIADTSRTVFKAVANQNFIDELKIGQQTFISLDNYSPVRYGYLSGKLVSTQIDLAGPEARYYLVIKIDDHDLPSLEYGMTGQVDIVTYHGTLLNYMMNKTR